MINNQPSNQGPNVVLPVTTSTSKRWRSVSANAATAHPLYGVKNWLAVFALSVLLPPLLNLGQLNSVAQRVGISITELLSGEGQDVIFTKAVLLWETLSALAILWVTLKKSPYFRIVSSVLLLSRWPVIALIGTTLHFEGRDIAVTGSLVPWLLSCAVWVPYLYRSRRVRITFEHCVQADDAVEPSEVGQRHEASHETSKGSLSPTAVSLGFVAVVLLLGFAFLRPNGSEPEGMLAKAALPQFPVGSKLTPLTAGEVAGVFAQPTFVPDPKPNGKPNAKGLPDLDFKTFEEQPESALKRKSEALDDARNLPSYQYSGSQGDIQSQVNLSRMYAAGSGVKQDKEASLFWEWKAAVQGHAASLNSMGDRFSNGWSVKKDQERARAWYVAAAQRGDVDAQVELSGLYWRGNGVPQDYQQAMAFGLMAAEQGDSTSQYRVGAWYSKGQGAKQNNVEGHKWLNLAAADGETRAAQARDDLERKMTSGEISEAQRRASAWSAKQKRP